MSNQWYDNNSLQWTDTNDQWGFTESGGTTYSGAYNIWTDESYVYVATSSGLDVISIETEQRQSFATYPSGYTSVWANGTHIYMGTLAAGVKRIAKTAIGPTELAFSVHNYLNVPDLLSEKVIYIHGNANIMAVATDAGMHIMHFGSSYLSKCSVSNIRKCFVTPTYNYVYYIVAGNKIHRYLDKVGSWTMPDKVYTAGSGFLSGVLEIRDIFVTEKTSLSKNDNTLFMATNNGVFILDEDSGYALKYTVG